MVVKKLMDIGSTGTTFPYPTGTRKLESSFRMVKSLDFHRLIMCTLHSIQAEVFQHCTLLHRLPSVEG